MIGFIKPDGEIINGEDYHCYTHKDFEEYLKLNIKGKYLSSVYVYKYIRINDGPRQDFSYEILAELPDEITDKQLYSLQLWLDSIYYTKPFVNIEIEADYYCTHIDHNETNTKFYKHYDFKDCLVDDIIKDIRKNIIIK